MKKISGKTQQAKVTQIAALQAVLLLLAILGIRYSSLEVGAAEGSIWFYSVVGIVAGVFSYALAMLIFRQLHSRSEKLRDLVATARSWVAHFGLGAIVLVSACAAIGEEMFFRVFLQNWAVQYVPIWMAVLGAAILFAAAHGASIVYFVIAIALGLAIGSVYVLTDSIALIMCWHFTYDLISFVVLVRYPGLLFLTPAETTDSAGADGGSP